MRSSYRPPVTPSTVRIAPRPSVTKFDGSQSGRSRGETARRMRVRAGPLDRKSELAAIDFGLCLAPGEGRAAPRKRNLAVGGRRAQPAERHLPGALWLRVHIGRVLRDVREAGNPEHRRLVVPFEL